MFVEHFEEMKQHIKV